MSNIKFQTENVRKIRNENYYNSKYQRAEKNKLKTLEIPASSYYTTLLEE